MNKVAKRILIIVLILAALVFAGFQGLKMYTKQFSPEREASYTQNDYTLTVRYSSPAKKNRVIFGGLVPYDQVWRTGANEATTFTTNKPLSLNGTEIPAGTYTLWTIPGKESWTVIINEGTYDWGVNFDGTPTYDEQQDVARVTVPVEGTLGVMEKFTIGFHDYPERIVMYLEWDDTLVTVPFE